MTLTSAKNPAKKTKRKKAKQLRQVPSKNVLKKTPTKSPRRKRWDSLKLKRRRKSETRRPKPRLRSKLKMSSVSQRGS